MGDIRNSSNYLADFGTDVLNEKADTFLFTTIIKESGENKESIETVCGDPSTETVSVFNNHEMDLAFFEDDDGISDKLTSIYLFLYRNNYCVLLFSDIQRSHGQKRRFEEREDFADGDQSQEEVNDESGAKYLKLKKRCIKLEGRIKEMEMNWIRK